MERISGEGGLGREHYYLDFSAHLDENIDKVLGGNSSPSPPLLVNSSSSFVRDPSSMLVPSSSSIVSDTAPSDRTVVSVAQSPSSPVNHWQEGQLGSGRDEGGKEWEEGEEKQENCTGTLDSIRTEGSLEEPRYAKVTHKQKRGSSSTPKLGRKKEEESRTAARDEFARNSVGVSTGNSPLHPVRAQEPAGLRLLEAPRPPSSSRHAGGEGRLLASQQGGQPDVGQHGVQHGHNGGQLNHQGNHRDEEEENGQDRTLTSTVTASTPATTQSSGSARDAFQRVSSAIYGQLLVLLGLLVPLSGPASASVVTPETSGYFDLFYIFLLLVSVLFLIFVFIDLVGARTQESLVMRRRRRSVEKVKEKLADSEADSGRSSKSSSEMGKICRSRLQRGRGEEENLPVVQLEREESFSSLLPKPTAEYGSFFLRLGTVIAGIGALIYTGIEVGGHLEQELVDSPCNGGSLLLLAVRPATQIIFILLQTYFLFLNNRMNLYKRKGTSRLGLIHLAATNLCIWLKELIQEVVAAAGADETSNLSKMEVNLEGNSINSSSIEINQTTQMGSCLDGKPGILGNLRMDSMDILFPLLAQYCLISAAILIVIWNQVGPEHEHFRLTRMRLSAAQDDTSACTRYSVDCRNSNSGLFCGILVVIVALVSTILFFVFVAREEDFLQGLALQLSAGSQLGLHTVAALATLVAGCQVRRLWFSEGGASINLDRVLLFTSQLGVCSQAGLVALATLLSDDLTKPELQLLQLLAAVSILVQPLLQTAFLLDASCRTTGTTAQARAKPGRQAVTFLLVCNLAMWVTSLLETARHDASPIQAGLLSSSLTWPLLSHLALPLAMLYRFHSSVCLYEIWKKSFRLRQSNLDFL